MPEEFSVDFTKAQTMQPLPAPGPYLCSINLMEFRTSQRSGGQNLHVEYTVMEPEAYANRRLFEDLSLDNEFTLGRIQTLLKALGEPEENVQSSNFKIRPDNYVGRQCTAFVSVESSDQWGERNRIRRVAPASAWEALSQP